MSYFKQLLIAIDQFFNALLGGWADETLSSAAYRMELQGRKWRWARKVIDLIFFWEKEHCRQAYESEWNRLQLPPEFRREETPGT